MESGTLLRWRIVEGNALPENGSETLCDVLPNGLTDDPDDGDPVLEIEAHEEGFLARILLAEGQHAKPDEAIAVIENAVINAVRKERKTAPNAFTTPAFPTTQ